MANRLELKDILKPGVYLKAFKIEENQLTKNIIEEILRKQQEIIERQRKSDWYDINPINSYGHF